jgi:putative endonuclease
MAECVAYILRCSDGTLYTGWTNNIRQRVRAHNAGTASKYTRSRLPVELVYCEVCEDKHQAMSREYAIKQLTRPEKLRLIDSGRQELIKREEEIGTVTE